MPTNHVFVLNADKNFLSMVHPARARKLLSQNKASVFRTFPFVIILKKQIQIPHLKQYILKIDPGAVWTGFAIQCGFEIVFQMELKHRSNAIKSDLHLRSGFRRGRRSRNLRYRKKRFDRKKQLGWLAPSLRHRVQTTETWIKRFIKYCPISAIEIEQVRFDTQKIIQPEISGVEYQQGVLWGYEIREYLLDKWGRKCAYCDVENVPLEIEHIQAKSSCGSDRVSNLTLACHDCNQQKGNLDVADFLNQKYKFDLIAAKNRIDKILKQRTSPLSSAAAVNSTRFAIVDAAKRHNSNVLCWTGGRTKMNRCQQGFPKSHSIDAACIGESGSQIKFLTTQPLIVEAKGHGTRQSRRTNDKGFPAITVKTDKKTGEKTTSTVAPKRSYKHIQAGDIIKFELKKDSKTCSDKKKAIESTVKVKAGWYTARVKTPTPKGFEVKIGEHRVTVSSMVGVKFIYRNDGFSYSFL
ncbi:MAG: HNH endonuclease [Cyanomargarita calcarea GSE-NOS-MK-12-04C]|jgi:5-methylcytosine-specific restriction endonuclease McrA|uniref:HNH endonuclease n=1 Tax=Cyanomargarita calcarea GSE-NOS-MK-12-04C TaxID=2839659 RepID=A0A951QP35_9CYAN|nr:HNH endonuclease [Cyanomargarita calcarea GSE-NOS-MK-12-04C]